MGAARRGGSCLGGGFCGGSCRGAGDGESRLRAEVTRGGVLLPAAITFASGGEVKDLVGIGFEAGFGGVSVTEVGIEENSDSVQDERSSW